MAFFNAMIYNLGSVGFAHYVVGRVVYNSGLMMMPMWT